MNPSILRRIIYPAYRAAKRDNVSSFAAEFDRTQWMSRSEILEYQWIKVLKLVEHTYETVPYYTRLFDTHGIRPAQIQTPDDLRRIPPLTKESFHSDLPSLCSSAVDRPSMHKDSTGGSTGERTWFYVDSNANQARQVSVIRGNAWCGALMGDKHATLWGAAFENPNNHQKIKSAIKSFMLNTVFLSAYGMTDQMLKAYARALQRYKPKLLTSYPSLLVDFAEFLQAHPEYRVHPGAIIASGETLFDPQRNLIEEAFGCKVFNRYGSREFSAIAHECEAHNGMHINAERVFVEIIKEDGSPAKSGETGQMLITDLDNYGMPFIRYAIDDLAVQSDRACKCGRGLPLVEKIEGRSFDVIVTPSGARYPGTFWTLLSKTVPGIRKFQLIQKEPSSIEIKVLPGPEFEENSLNRLDDVIREQTKGELRTTIEVVDAIPLTRTGKHRFIVSELTKAAEN